MPAKRQQVASVGANAKKPKLANEVVGVIDAIASAEHLTPECRQMLITGCSGSLGEYADVRHAHQELVVGLIGQVLSDSKTALKAALAMDEARMSHLNAKKAEHAVVVDGAKRLLDVKCEQVKRVEEELQALAQGTAAASEALQAAGVAHAERAAKSMALASDKARLEDSILQHLSPAQAGDVDAAHGEVLSALALEFELEESLRLALPKTFAKPKEQRHSFDDLVLQELELVLRARIGKVDAELVAENVHASDKAEAVKVAQLVVEQVVATEGGKDEELLAARTEYEQQIGICGAALDASVAFESEHSQGVAALETLTAKLDAFTYPWECYALFKDRVTKRPEVETLVVESVTDVSANVVGVPFDSTSQVALAVECIADTETTNVSEANTKMQCEADTVVSVELAVRGASQVTPATECTAYTVMTDVSDANTNMQCETDIGVSVELVDGASEVAPDTERIAIAERTDVTEANPKMQCEANKVVGVEFVVDGSPQVTPATECDAVTETIDAADANQKIQFEVGDGVNIADSQVGREFGA